MARGTKTGGRDFKKGNRMSRGRPKGSKDKIPRTFKASVALLFRELGEEDRDRWKAAIQRSMRLGGRIAFPYFQMAAHYLDGKPADQVDVNTTQPINIIFPKDESRDDDENRSGVDSPDA